MTKTKSIPLYKIILDDGEVYNGGSLKETKWNSIPNNKEIKRMFYRLPTGDYLSMQNYEKYYHMIEATQDLNGQSKEEKLAYIYLMGKRGNKVLVYKINLCNKIGSVETKVFKEDSKFIQGLNNIGWKKGVIK